MALKEIKIYMSHPSCKDVLSLLKYLHLEQLTKNFNFIWEPENPDYLFVSEQMYSNKQEFNKFLKQRKKTCILIQYLGEAVSPDFNTFDYCISYDDVLEFGDRHTQLPPSFIRFKKFLHGDRNPIKSIASAHEELKKKKEFCNFLYSNYRAHPFRDELFYKISEYKHVNSLGRHLNNMNNVPTGYGGHEQEIIDIKNPYKFSIASENALFRGYISEKLLTSLEASTIPIYWGNPNVTKYINPKSFINCFDYTTFDKLKECIKKIDENDDLWCEIISQPWQTEEQILLQQKQMNKYIDFFIKIFSQSKLEAKRAPEGAFIDIYDGFINNASPSKITLVNHIYQKVKAEGLNSMFKYVKWKL